MKKFFILFALSFILILTSVVMPMISTSAQNTLGDVNGDGVVDNLDATKILRYDAGLIDLTQYEIGIADVNTDSGVDNLDSVLILLYDAGINDTVNGKPSESDDSSGTENSSSDDESDYISVECSHADTAIINRTDATVQANGYSGDEYCSLCNTIINQGIVLEKFTEYDLPLSYYVYTSPSGERLVLPKGVSVMEYTLKRANKSAVSQYSEVEAEILRLVNLEREKEGIAPLKNQSNAYYFSLKRSAECAEDFSHTRPNGTSCFTVFDECDVIYMTAGENLFKCSGYPTNVLAQTSVNAWMNSEGHRANILNANFTSVSIAISYDEATNSYYITQLFLA